MIGVFEQEWEDDCGIGMVSFFCGVVGFELFEIDSVEFMVIIVWDYCFDVGDEVVFRCGCYVVNCVYFGE